MVIILRINTKSGNPDVHLSFSVAERKPAVIADRINCLMWMAETFDWIYELVKKNVFSAHFFPQNGYELRREIIFGVAHVLAMIQTLESSSILKPESLDDIATRMQELKDQQTGNQLLSFSNMVGFGFHLYQQEIGAKFIPVRLRLKPNETE